MNLVNNNLISNDISFILNSIKRIYEILTIYKAIFIVHSKIYDILLHELENDSYSISTIEKFSDFEKNKTRIIMIKDTDFLNINKIYCNIHFKDTINLILFIDTPKFIDDNIFKSLLLCKNLDSCSILEI